MTYMRGAPMGVLRYAVKSDLYRRCSRTPSPLCGKNRFQGPLFDIYSRAKAPSALFLIYQTSQRFRFIILQKISWQKNSSKRLHMRNIVIERITEALVACPDLQVYYDISPEKLHTLSNEELLDLYGDFVLEFYDGIEGVE